MCVCVRACVRACVGVCLCVVVDACALRAVCSLSAAPWPVAAEQVPPGLPADAVVEAPPNARGAAAAAAGAYADV